MVLWTRSSPHPKRHLDRFSRFCRAHGRDRQTNTQIDVLGLGLGLGLGVGVERVAMCREKAGIRSLATVANAPVLSICPYYQTTLHLYIAV